jgi:hypothetical protein
VAASEAHDLGAIALYRQIHGRARVMQLGNPELPAEFSLDKSVEGAVRGIDRLPFLISWGRA